MNCLVTGGMGFIGTYIIKELIKDGEQIIAYDSYPNSELHERVLTKADRDKIKIVQGDITDLAQLTRTVKEHKVDKIVHMAYILTNETSANPPLGIRVNINGTNNIFEAARIMDVKKVVWASSISVYGPAARYKEQVLSNDAPQYCANLYGACKSFNEQMATHYYNRFGVNSIAIRFTWIYGPGQRGNGASATITRGLMENPALGKEGSVPDGESMANWLYVEDAARSVALACKVDKTETRAFNINGDVRSMKEAADYVKSIIPTAKITLAPGKGVQSATFDSSLIEKELGFKFTWSMERGMKQTINTLRQWNGLPPI
ncbi:MAG: NAD(P)-dependent oxidoreductase [Dehalococcoidales bacterium]|nr:NAD(P)-dependent oxidoreductase [Dehalococcoidales bacterium]